MNKYNKDQNPFFSIILPTYNREKYIILAIESILAQSYDNYEIIVVDDGSKDETEYNLKPFRQKIKYLYQENQGVSSARNKGIKESSGQWIAFIDSDDEWLPDYLETQRNNILNNPECCLHMMNSIQIDKYGKETDTFRDNPSDILLRSKLIRPEDPLSFVIRNHLYYLQPTVILRNVLIKAGGFNEKLSIAEDLDIIARVAHLGPIAIHNIPLVKIIKRGKEQPNLTEQISAFGIKSQEAIGSIYSNLLSMKELSSVQAKLLQHKYGANRRAIGNLHIRAGSRFKALLSYTKAFRVDLSWQSILRIILLVLPKKLLLQTITKDWHVNP